MTRIALAIAAALLAALPFVGSPAEACISCEYTPPPGVAAQQKSPSAERIAPRRERRNRDASESREAKKSHVTETAKPESEKVRKVEQAPQREKADKVETAATATPNAEVENSSFALGTGVRPVVAAKTQTAGNQGGEHSTIATAAHTGSDGELKAANAGDGHEPASKAQGCSRYFPTVGQTIKVPCE
ncbi:MAG: hypothetical protein ABI457_10470 [Hyphomicrobium sp.]